MTEARTQQSPLASRRSTDTQGTVKSSSSEGNRLRLPNNLFPLGYKEGFSQWWSAISPAAAEATVLGFLPFNNKPTPALSPEDGHVDATASPPEVDPHGPRECASNMVPLSGKDRIINEFTITRTAEGDPKHHLIMLHGYGAGLAFFYRNYDMLSRRPGWKIWSLDLLGYGRSSRPPFHIKSKEPDAKITEAEDWFIDALEEWRQARGIERFTLLGHSLGGYLATRYTLKYKNRVNKLILVSPAGVPEDPYAVREDLPDNPKSTIQDEYLQSQEEATQSNPNIPETLKVPHDSGDRAHSIHSAPGSTTDLPHSAGESKTANATPRRPLPKWLTCLWEANISPFSLVRWSGPLGPRLVSGWTSRRFSQLPQAESTALHNYAYSLFRQRGSGEYALAYVLAPGAFARRPLLWKVQDLVGTPSVWMYGEMDWMDIAGGYAAEENIRNTKIPEEVEKEGAAWIGGGEWRGEKKGRGGEAKVQIVQKAGHHLYLDGWEQFNGLMNEEMRDVEVREGKRKEAAN